MYPVGQLKVMMFRCYLDESMTIWKENSETCLDTFDQNILVKHRIVQVQHPACYLDLVLSIFSKLKIPLKDKIWGHGGH